MAPLSMIKHFRTVPFLLFLVLGFVSCKPSEVTNQNFKYFDIGSFTTEIRSNLEQDKLYKKVVQLDRETDSLMISGVEADSVLQLLYSIDLNADQYANHINVDTFSSDGNQTIRYTNNNPKLALNHCTITSDSKGVLQLVVTTSEKSILYSTDKKYEYFRDVAFRVTTNQKTSFFPEVTYKTGISLTPN